MKKKELILDFTSLLDVILILLFIVTASMSRASLSANDEISAELEQTAAQLALLDEEREQLLFRLEILEAEEAEQRAALLELQQLKESYAALEDEYDHLKITTGYHEDDLTLYREAIEKVTRVVLLCETSLNSATGNQEVKVDIYLDTKDGRQQSYVDSVIIPHDFSLSAQERERLAADRVVELTKALSAAFRSYDNRMAWFTIQYAYDDVNFANSDMEIINKAIENLEHSFDVACFAQEMKIY